MLRRGRYLLLAVSLAAVAACSRAGQPGPASPQPIRIEKEPGESVDTVSAVPDSGSSSSDETTSSSSTSELEIDEDSSDGDADGKEGDKGADKADGESGEGKGEADGEDGAGGEPSEIEIEIEP